MKKTSLLFLSSALAGTAASLAGDALLFVSAFAPGEKSAIHALSFDTDKGTLKELQRNADAKNPFFLAVHPGKKHLFASYSLNFGGKEDEQVAAYAIEGRTGRLKLLNQASARGRATCYVEADSTGSTVFAANYTSGTVVSLPFSKDGVLGEAASFFQHPSETPPTDGGAAPAKKIDPKAHSIVPSPDNRFVLVADLGINKVLVYKTEAGSRLVPNPKQASIDLPKGAGPRHLIFAPSGERVYVINETGNSISYLPFNKEDGSLSLRQTLSTLPEDFSGKSYCADLKLSPDGRHLYGTNRGHDSIAVFRVAADGTLERTAVLPSGGKGPQNLLISPDGKWLLCANMPSDNIAVFKLDSASGLPSQHGEVFPLPRPSCIRLLPE